MNTQPKRHVRHENAEPNYGKGCAQYIILAIVLLFVGSMIYALTLDPATLAQLAGL